MSKKSWSQAIIRVFRAILIFPIPLSAEEISRTTRMSLKKVHEALANLIEEGYVSTEDGRTYRLDDNGDRNFLLRKIEEEKHDLMLSLKGSSLSSIRTPHEIRGPFYDPLFLPRRDGLYGCRLMLPTADIEVLDGLVQLIRSCHYALHGTYWTLLDYQDFTEVGVGTKVLVDTLKARHERTVALYLSMAIEDRLYGFDCFFYHLSARCTAFESGECVLVMPTLTVILDRIPVGKEFAISWQRTGPLPYVTEYKAEVSELLDGKFSLGPESFLGFIPDSDIVVTRVSDDQPPIFARLYSTRVSIQELAQKKIQYHVGLARWTYSLTHEEFPGSSEVHLLTATLEPKKSTS